MPDDGVPHEFITRAELTELAGLFDQFEFAFNPLSLSAREAESRFGDLILRMFEERVRPLHPGLPFNLFHSRIKTWCRVFLRKSQT